MSQTADQVLLGASEDAADGGAFVRGVFEALLLATRVSNTLPAAEEFAFRTTYDGFSEGAEKASEQVLELLQLLLDFARNDGAKRVDVHRAEDPTEAAVFDNVADVVDGLLEQVEAFVEESSGRGAKRQMEVMKGQLRPRGLALAGAGAGGKSDKAGAFAAMAAASGDVPKPQLEFMDEIDNSRDRPFMPRLRSKPHAVTPLDLVPTPSDGGEHGGRYPEYFAHPYEAELQKFKPQPWQLEVPKEADLVVPQSLDRSKENPNPPPHKYIDTEADLRAMLQDLTGCREVAIDLEHHSYRTFQGILCLMQLSTRSADYIIDAIALRRRLHLLAPLLADPRVLKVLHGADSDVLWLQRDAGAYIVNMFDTGRAARALDLPSRGLAYALKEFCGFEADKKHQLGDWRVRPLPPAMLKYAQADTHYLLHVYDRLRAMLGTPEAIAQVLESSRELCLQRYEKEAFDPEGWRRLLQRIGGEGAGALDSTQQARMAALWDWRDALAREEDESPGYVMSAYLMLRLARAAPASHDALVRCAAPLPPLVQQRSDEVIALLAAAAAPAPSPDSVTLGRVGAQRRRGGGSYGRQFSVTPGASVATEGAAPMDVGGGGNGDGEKGGEHAPLGTCRLACVATANLKFDTRARMAHTMVLSIHSAASASARAQSIRDEIARAPVLSLRHAAAFLLEGEKPAAAAATAGASGAAPAAEADVKAEAAEAPRSMAEVYELSNRNRRRYADKQHADAVASSGGGSGSGSSSAGSGGSDSEEGAVSGDGGRRRHKRAGAPAPDNDSNAGGGADGAEAEADAAAPAQPIAKRRKREAAAAAAAAAAPFDYGAVAGMAGAYVDAEQVANPFLAAGAQQQRKSGGKGKQQNDRLRGRDPDRNGSIMGRGGGGGGHRGGGGGGGRGGSGRGGGRKSNGF